MEEEGEGVGEQVIKTIKGDIDVEVPLNESGKVNGKKVWYFSKVCFT